ncbi:copper resistance CopC family protein [Agrococcus sp. ProA11]|uniref:copper resistance CopC family protein n=1 Tax=Agrococcus chionoecetis TaxID=3153752 RepID=UPI0032615B04
MLPALAVLSAALLLPAHASVIGSTPADGATVTEQPGTFSVVMNEQILSVDGADSSNAIQITDASGRYYGDGCLTVDGDTASLDAQLGEAGDYTVTYQVVSADGHPVSDTIEFAFEPAAGEAGAPGVAEAPVCGAAATESAEPAPAETPAASADASDEAAPATASAQQGDDADTDASAEDDAAPFPFLTVGVLAVLAVLAVIAYRANRMRTSRQARDTDEV